MTSQRDPDPTPARARGARLALVRRERVDAVLELMRGGEWSRAHEARLSAEWGITAGMVRSVAGEAARALAREVDPSTALAVLTARLERILEVAMEQDPPDLRAAVSTIALMGRWLGLDVARIDIRATVGPTTPDSEVLRLAMAIPEVRAQVTAELARAAGTVDTVGDEVQDGSDDDT